MCAFCKAVCEETAGWGASVGLAQVTGTIQTGWLLNHRNVWLPVGRRGAAMITRTLFWVTGVSLWLHRAEGWRELPGTSHPIQEGSTLMTSLLPITPPTPWALGVPTYEFGGNTDFQACAWSDGLVTSSSSPFSAWLCGRLRRESCRPEASCMMSRSLSKASSLPPR